MDDLICTAIAEMRLLSVEYGGGFRIVEPHRCGYSGDGSLLLNCYQIEGYSESGDVQGWKNFRFSKIGSLEILDRNFDGVRAGYNPSGDTRIPSVICEL